MVCFKTENEGLYLLLNINVDTALCAFRNLHLGLASYDATSASFLFHIIQ